MKECQTVKSFPYLMIVFWQKIFGVRPHNLEKESCAHYKSSTRPKISNLPDAKLFSPAVKIALLEVIKLFR